MTSNASSYVAYKTIIGHYNTVLKLLGLVPYKGSLDVSTPARSPTDTSSDDEASDSQPVSRRRSTQRARNRRKMSTTLHGQEFSEGAVPQVCRWPPETVALSTAGGVGLFGVYTDLSPPTPYHRPTASEVAAMQRASSRKADKKVPGRLIVTEIPTVIHVLEPNLSVEDFRRLKRDAGFQNKTTRMCEGCFLVYAQVGFAVCRVRFFDVLMLSVLWRDRSQWQ
jgi:hypothetical protein